MKVLVLGSAGFLMSNFIRYVSYRSKDFEFVSVDRLTNPENIRFVYRHRNHKFYIGDTSDKYFMDRIIYVEKPDFIVNGVYETDKSKKFIDACLLSSYGIPFIMLEYLAQRRDIEFIEPVVLKNKGSILFLPNCFGWRQKINSGFAKILYDCSKGKVNVSEQMFPWSFAEDIASFLWFMIEKKSSGSVLYAPVSSTQGAEFLVGEIIKTLQLTDVEINKTNSIDDLYCGEWPRLLTKEWKSDYNGFLDPLQKTINWYAANKWIFSIGEKND
jgi:dTDP-D-glucose 4,6-dehydratase